MRPLLTRALLAVVVLIGLIGSLAILRGNYCFFSVCLAPARVFPEFSWNYPGAIAYFNQEQQDVPNPPSANGLCTHAATKVFATDSSAEAVSKWYAERLLGAGWKREGRTFWPEETSVEVFDRAAGDFFTVGIDDPALLAKNRGIHVAAHFQTVFELRYIIQPYSCPGTTVPGAVDR